MRLKILKWRANLRMRPNWISLFLGARGKGPQCPDKWAHTEIRPPLFKAFLWDAKNWFSCGVRCHRHRTAKRGDPFKIFNLIFAQPIASGWKRCVTDCRPFSGTPLGHLLDVF